MRNNLLTYYKTPEKENALKTVLSVLTPGGILITGSHEGLPTNFDDMKISPDYPMIYIKSLTHSVN
jgi:chemotaxis methyl-accepting protein methylase